MTDAYPSALVSARNGIPLDLVVKHSACTGQPLSVIRNRKSAMVQTLADLRKGGFMNVASFGGDVPYLGLDDPDSFFSE